jgi:hypothetical protein
LLGISNELAEQGDWALALNLCLKISSLSYRQDCLRNLVSTFFENYGASASLLFINALVTNEDELFYFKCWVEKVNVGEVDDFCIQQVLPKIVHDSYSIDLLLQKYAVQQVIINKFSPLGFSRLNRTLNIQWLLDITAQFPNHEVGTTRCSINLSEWLHEIADEDDREQIELWAKQVAKCKITEEEFGERVKAQD